MKKTLLTMALMLAIVGNLMAAQRDTMQLTTIKQKATLPVSIGSIEYSLSAQWPATDTVVATALRQWTQGLMEQMTGVKPTDGQGLLSPTVQTGFVGQSAQDMKRLETIMRKEKDVTPRNYLCDLTLKRESETKEFITYSLVCEFYAGGAHGMHYRHYATLRKKDGHLLTWNDVISNKGRTRFSQAVADGLKSFFGVQNFKQMQDRLQIEGDYSRSNFPMPATHPAFTDAGLVVQYQYYEIAAYANGAPTVTLPYNQVSRLLTALGQKAARR